jgi:hypothetical protein
MSAQGSIPAQINILALEYLTSIPIENGQVERLRDVRRKDFEDIVFSISVRREATGYIVSQTSITQLKGDLGTGRATVIICTNDRVNHVSMDGGHRIAHIRIR